jgi:P4 family phage/plasmid primase-like protien
MTGDEMYFWATDTFHDSDGQMCRLMKQQLERQIDKMKKAPDSHPNLTNAHWELINLAAEGHSGWLKAVQKYNDIWLRLAGEKRDEMPDTSEVTRSAFGTISKLEPVVNSDERHGYIPDDPCASGGNVFNVAEWGYQTDGEEQIAASDFSGLGPVVGKIETHATKPADQYPMNDRGNGQHFVDLYQDDVKFVDSRRSWVLWDGERWYRDLDDKLVGKAYSRVERLQTKFAAELPRGDDTQIRKAEAWRKWGVKSGNVPVIKNALTIAKGLDVGDKPVALSGREFDANPMLLGCANGILDLAYPDRGVRAPRKEDYVTYNTRVPYIPWDTDMAHETGLIEQYNLWLEYLKIFQPDPEMRKFVQKVLGHLLVGENPEKLIIFVYGEHDTGKSTLLGGLSGALGDYYGTIDINLFRNKELNPQLIRAVPLRVTGMSEVDAGRMDASTMKRLTGNDKVVAEAKYSNDIFEGRPQFTTLIACNNEPEIQHSDEALRERVLILPFDTTISRSLRRYDKQTEIERHSGVATLAWLVEGWKLYCAEGLLRRDWPAEVKRLCGEVVSHFNATQTFISECLDKWPATKEGVRAQKRALDKAAGRGKPAAGAAEWEAEWTPPAAVVYELYTRWCNTNGVPAVSHPDLSKEIALGKPQVKNVEGKSVRCYVGVRIKVD